MLARPWWLLPIGRVNPWWWTGIGALLLALDFVAGPTPRFPLLYAIPVILAAWYSGRATAVALGVILPAAHIAFLAALWESATLPSSIVATVLRGGIVLLIAVWFARLSVHERAVHRYVERLEGLLPICSFCKSIRNTAGDWEPLELFISTRSEAQFSHGLCPTCGRHHYPEVDLEAAFAEDAVIKH